MNPLDPSPSAGEPADEMEVEHQHAWALSSRLAAVNIELDTLPPAVAALIAEARGLHPQMAPGNIDPTRNCPARRVVLFLDDRRGSPAIWSDAPIEVGVLRSGMELANYESDDIFMVPTVGDDMVEPAAGHLEDAVINADYVGRVFAAIDAKAKGGT